MTVHTRDSLDAHEFFELPNFTLTGPFFVDCGHGCAHVATTHGQGQFISASERRRVFDTNIASIENSDFVFAHINEVDCFGTLFELGHANAAGIPTFIHFGEDLTDRQKSELWFARMGCIPVLGELEYAFERALDAWRAACAANSL